MHHEFARTSPAVAPNDIEWAFRDGQPAIVAHVPNGEGDYEVFRLDQIAPDSRYQREFARALLRLAQQRLDETEPVSVIGASA